MHTNEIMKICTTPSTLGGGRVRNELMDAVKFWLIVLTIAVHVFNRKEFADSTACVVSWNWIAIFQMPLFVFISGYFSRKKENKDFWPSIWKLLEPLIIFQIIALLFYVDSLSIRTVLTPWFMLWYLLSLIFWRLLLQFIPDKVLRHKKLILISTFFMGIFAGFLPFDKFLSIQRTLSLMPFFFWGYFMKGKNLYLPDKYKPFCAVFLIGLFVLMFFYPYRMNDLQYAIPYKNIFGAARRLIAFATAIPMSIAFFNVCYYTPRIARQGRLTMQYYIYHGLIIPSNFALITPPFVVIVDKMNLPVSFGTAVFIILVVTVGLGLILKVPLIRMMTNPSSFFLKRG